MRTRLTIALSSAVLLAASSAMAQLAAPSAQPGAGAKPAADAASEQTSRLEAELGKVRDASPEAAELMLQLVDLYHQHGRVFGLVRGAQQFVNLQAAHPRHKEVMLKLIDGLVATSRNKETTAMCRQFLERYADYLDGPRLEVVLAEALDQVPDLPGAAAAHEAVWKRQGPSPRGRESAVRAVQIQVA